MRQEWQNFPSELNSGVGNVSKASVKSADKPTVSILSATRQVYLIQLYPFVSSLSPNARTPPPVRQRWREESYVCGHTLKVYFWLFVATDVAIMWPYDYISWPQSDLWFLWKSTHVKVPNICTCMNPAPYRVLKWVEEEPQLYCTRSFPLIFNSTNRPSSQLSTY